MSILLNLLLLRLAARWKIARDAGDAEAADDLRDLVLALDRGIEAVYPRETKGTP
jgi:hypothetical protein